MNYELKCKGLLVVWGLFYSLWAQAQKAPFGGLKPGIYYNLKPTTPLVLDTGSYTFIGLEMRCMVPPSGVRGLLDARKARSLTLLHCTFEGNGSGTAVLSSGDLTVDHCTFKNMETGIRSATQAGTTETLTLTGNTFTDNRTAIWLNRNGNTGTATMDFTLKCNQFRLSCAELPHTDPDDCDAEPDRKGLVIGEGVTVRAPNGLAVEPNTIGGSNGFNTTLNGPAYPNANEWPVEAGTDRTTMNSNIQVDWTMPVHWTPVDNQSANPIRYFRYTNEFVQNNANENIDVFYTSPFLRVKTDGTTPATGVTYDTPCENLITDVYPIFPTRIAVVDSTDILTGTSAKAGTETWLGDAAPNPSQFETHFIVQIPQTEQMALLQFVEVGTGKVLSTKVLSERGKLDVSLDTRKVASGTYLYRVVLKDKILGPRKLVVQK